MKLNALIFCLGTLCIPLMACQQTPPTATASAASATQACDDLKIRNGNDFVSTKVLLLSPTYDPTSGVGPAASQIIGPVPSQYRNDLARAFTISPDFFKNQLCSLTYVFVVQCSQNPCTAQDALTHSWGMREWKGAKSGEYTGISAALWQNTSSALGFESYRNMRLLLVLSTISGNANLPNTWQNSPRFSARPNNKGEMSVLASLAHEAGHVLWYDKFVPFRGGDINLNNFCGGFYAPDSWTGIDIPNNRWLAFGDQLTNEVHKPDYLTPIKRDLMIGPNFPRAGDDLNTLFNDPGLTGTLATVSPVEDFVETYMLYVLLSSKESNIPQLQNLWISITGSSQPHQHDIADLSNKPVLSSKMGCFAGSVANLRNMIGR
jgi:hypothetical protein